MFTSNTISFILLFFFFSVCKGEDKITLNIGGVSPEIENLLIKNDAIVDYSGLKNITVKYKNVEDDIWMGNKKVMYTPSCSPGSKHFLMNIPVEVFKSQYYDIEEPLLVRVLTETIYGNYIWTDVIRDKTNFDEPIIMDKYNGFDGDIKKSPRIGYQVIMKGFEPGPSTTLISGDQISNIGNNSVYEYKNSESEKWQPRQEQNIEISNSGFAKFTMNLIDSLDMESPIDIRVGVKTSMNNWLWFEESFSIDDSYRSFRFTNYSAEFGNTNSSIVKTGPTKPGNQKSKKN